MSGQKHRAARPGLNAGANSPRGHALGTTKGAQTTILFPDARSLVPRGFPGLADALLSPKKSIAFDRTNRRLPVRSKRPTSLVEAAISRSIRTDHDGSPGPAFRGRPSRAGTPRSTATELPTRREDLTPATRFEHLPVDGTARSALYTTKEVKEVAVQDVSNRESKPALTPEELVSILEKKRRQKSKTSRSTSSASSASSTPATTTVFARVSGIIEFECPRCRTISRCHVDGLTMRVRCGASRCRRKYLLGLRLFAGLPGARFRPHPDHVAPPFRDWHPGPHELPAREARDSGSPPSGSTAGSRPWIPAEASPPPAHRNDPRNHFVELPVDEDDEAEFERAASEIVAASSAGGDGER